MRLLGALIGTITSLLLSQGVALAHGVGHGDQPHARLEASNPAESDVVSSSRAISCHALEIVRSSGVIAGTLFIVGPNGDDDADDWSAGAAGDSNDDCCGVACHAVVGTRGYTRLLSYFASSPVALTGTSELLGTKQRRLERPPRRF